MHPTVRCSRRSNPTDQRRAVAKPNKPIQGFHTGAAKLDVGFVDDPKAGKDSGCHWSPILFPRELKSNPSADKASKAWLDLGTYAREVLAAQDTRRFVWGFKQFISTVLGFLWMSEEELGFDPTIMTVNGERFIEIERNS